MPDSTRFHALRTNPLVWMEHFAGERCGKRLQTVIPELLQALEVSDQATARLLRQLRDEGLIFLQRDTAILKSRVRGKTSQDVSLGPVTSTDF